MDAYCGCGLDDDDDGDGDGDHDNGGMSLLSANLAAHGESFVLPRRLMGAKDTIPARAGKGRKKTRTDRTEGGAPPGG
jgi:hypothetical protein